MHSATFVMMASGIWAILNAVIMKETLSYISAKEFPQAPIFNIASAAVTALSLCSDLFLLMSTGTKAGKPMGTSFTLKNTLKMMPWALAIKVFVITFDFFTVPMYYYNCYLDCIRKLGKAKHLLYWRMERLKWQNIRWLLFMVSVTAMMTIFKVFILYFIHDFYEGVKQQGTLDSNGLLNADDMQRQSMQTAKQVMPTSCPTCGIKAPGVPTQCLHPTSGMLAPGTTTQGL
ncbi:uncharacterized protein [Dermacentor albipictus]|uniref:uncharacterized protein isoform X2 n=1 Tax=Dermacentor albipictus TaxID=60249 RepID=UPI0031FC8DC9